MFPGTRIAPHPPRKSNNVSTAAMHTPLRSWVNFDASRRSLSSPVYTHLRTYRCTALTDAKGHLRHFAPQKSRELFRRWAATAATSWAPRATRRSTNPIRLRRRYSVAATPSWRRAGAPTIFPGRGPTPAPAAQPTPCRRLPLRRRCPRRRRARARARPTATSPRAARATRRHGRPCRSAPPGTMRTAATSRVPRSSAAALALFASTISNPYAAVR